jgi:hypothetical protein
MTVRGGGEDTLSKTSLTNRWKKGLRNLRNDERGAETGEYIMWGGLTIFAIAIIAGILYKAFKSKAEGVADCLDNSTQAGFNACN